MNLLNNILDTDQIQINKFSKVYIKILLGMLILLLLLLLIKKNYYYENELIYDNTNIILLSDKNTINKIKNSKVILVNDIESDYSINRIIDKNDTCYVDIKLNSNIEGFSSGKYKILLGKETILEYFIRIIKKVS